MLDAAEPKLRPPDRAFDARAAAIAADVDPRRIERFVRALPGPRSRLHAPDAMRRADEMIVEGIRASGWLAERRPFTFSDAYGISDGATDGEWEVVAYPELHGTNVVATLEGASRDAWVVLAHHDTVRASPGADDNGASIGALVELSRLLAGRSFRDTIVLAAVDMEEIGLFGSRALVAELLTERTVRGAIVFETMAYTSREPGSQQIPIGLDAVYVGQAERIAARGFVGDFAAVLYRENSVELSRAFAEAMRALQGRDSTVLLRDPLDLPGLGEMLEHVPYVRDFARSDHKPFWDAGLPAIMVTDTANFRNPHYHRPTDTPDTLDYEHVAAIVAATAATIERVAGAAPGSVDGGPRV